MLSAILAGGLLVACQPADPFHSGARGGSSGQGSEKAQAQSVEVTSANLTDYAYYLVSRLSEAKNLAELGLNLSLQQSIQQELLSPCERLEFLGRVHQGQSLTGLGAELWRLASPYCRLKGLMPLQSGRAIVDGSYYFHLSKQGPESGQFALKVVAQDLAVELEAEERDSFSALADLRESRELRLVQKKRNEVDFAEQSQGQQFFMHYRVTMHSLRQTLRHEGLQETAYETGDQYINIQGTLLVDDFGKAISFAVESMNLRVYAPREVRKKGQASRSRYNEINLALLPTQEKDPLIFVGACSAPQGKLRAVGARQVAGGDGRRLSGVWTVAAEDQLCPHAKADVPRTWHGAYWLVFLR